MTKAISAQNLSQGPTNFNRPILSQYLNEDDYSIFSNPVYNSEVGTFPSGINPLGVGTSLGGGVGYNGGLGFGGFGMGANGDYVDNYVDMSRRYAQGMAGVAGDAADAQATATFRQRGDQYTTNTTSQILANTLRNVKIMIQEGDTKAATELYDQACAAISKETGNEMNKQEDRVDKNQSLRNEVAQYYAQINGSSLVNDIKANGHSNIGAGWYEAINHEKCNTADETIAYMTGTAVTGESTNGFMKFLGKAAGFLPGLVTSLFNSNTDKH